MKHWMSRINRKFFFLIERLEISRSERITIVLLSVMLLLLTGYSLLTHPAANYDPVQYSELEKIFEERSRKLEEDKSEIMARYVPSAALNPAEEGGGTAERAENTTARENPQENQSAAGKTIDINRATKEELQQLPGIGPAYAGRIIQWREKNGSFTSAGQLLEIRGIGERRLEQLLPYIRI